MSVSKDELVFSKDYHDFFSDLIIPGAMKIGEEEFFRLTFLKHNLTPTHLPSQSGQQIPVQLQKEVQCSITIPWSVAEALLRSFEDLKNSTPEQA